MLIQLRCLLQKLRDNPDIQPGEINMIYQEVIVDQYNVRDRQSKLSMSLNQNGVIIKPWPLLITTTIWCCNYKIVIQLMHFTTDIINLYTYHIVLYFLNVYITIKNQWKPVANYIFSFIIPKFLRFRCKHKTQNISCNSKKFMQSDIYCSINKRITVFWS